MYIARWKTHSLITIMWFSSSEASATTTVWSPYLSCGVFKLDFNLYGFFDLTREYFLLFHKIISFSIEQLMTCHYCIGLLPFKFFFCKCVSMTGQSIMQTTMFLICLNESRLINDIFIWFLSFGSLLTATCINIVLLEHLAVSGRRRQKLESQSAKCSTGGRETGGFEGQMKTFFHLTVSSISM